MEPALESAEPAEELTLDRPSDALDWAWAVFSFAAPAASDVDEALRVPARRTANVERRNTARDAATDIVTGDVSGRGDVDDEELAQAGFGRLELREKLCSTWPTGCGLCALGKIRDLISHPQPPHLRIQ
jgi:hypothetical protein